MQRPPSWLQTSQKLGKEATSLQTGRACGCDSFTRDSVCSLLAVSHAYQLSLHPEISGNLFTKQCRHIISIPSITRTLQSTGPHNKEEIYEGSKTSKIRDFVLQANHVLFLRMTHMSSKVLPRTISVTPGVMTEKLYPNGSLDVQPLGLLGRWRC